MEVRLAGRHSLLPRDVTRFTAVVFGPGDFRTPTEHRPLPPLLRPGDELQLGSLRAVVITVLAHPRLIELRFENPVAAIWEGLARQGRPIQYAYVPEPLAIWDTWTTNRQPSRGLRGAFGGIHPRLDSDRRASRSRSGVCHADPRGRSFLQRATPTSIGCCRSTSRTTFQRRPRH